MLFGFFCARIWKNCSHIWNQPSQTCLIGKLAIRQVWEKLKKKKNSDFETKNAIFGFFWARIFKTYCDIWNEHPWIFPKKQNYLLLGPKNTYSGILEVEFLKNYCHIWNQHHRICLFAKFCKKTKQKCLSLGPKILSWGFSGLESEKSIFIFNISTLEFVLLENFVKKVKKYLILGQNYLIWVFCS